MNKTLAFYISLSILLPVITGIVRFGKIQQSYYPLIYLAVGGMITEFISYNSKNNAVVTNIYVLFEFILYCWQFYNWKNTLRTRKWLYLLITSFTLLWITECIVMNKIGTFDLYYRIAYSFTLVLFAVNQLNYLIINEKHEIIFNSIFILCSSMIIFYAYKCLMEIFYRYAHNSNIEHSIFSIQIYVNVLFNILLTLVILCIPKKRTITLR